MQVETDGLRTLEEVEAFVNRHAGAEIKALGRAAAYAQIGTVVRRFAYWKRRRAEKGLLRRYLQLTTGLSESQLTRLVGRYLREGESQDRHQIALRPLDDRNSVVRAHPPAAGCCLLLVLARSTVSGVFSARHVCGDDFLQGSPPDEALDPPNQPAIPAYDQR